MIISSKKKNSLLKCGLLFIFALYLLNLNTLENVCAEKILSMEGAANKPLHINAYPESINEHLFVSESSMLPITISNTGTDDINWELDICPGLDMILKNLNVSYTAVTEYIPNPRNIKIDMTTYEITNNVFQQYKHGNQLYTNLGRLNYTDNTMIKSQELGSNGEYFTAKYPGIFIFASRKIQISQFKVQGELSASDSKVDSAIIETTINGIDYNGFIKRIYDNYYSINHLMIIPKSANVTHDYSSDPKSDDHSLSSIEDVRRLYYLLFWTSSWSYVSNDKMQQIMISFLNNAIHFKTPFMYIPKSKGIMPANTSETVPIYLNTQELPYGNYHSALQLFTSDPDMPYVEIPVSLTLTGESRLSISPTTISFDEVWLEQSTSKFLTVNNSGTDELTIHSQSNHFSFTVNPSNITVFPGESQLLTITFSSLITNTIQGEICLNSNDPDNETVHVSVSGTALSKPDMHFFPPMIFENCLTSDLSSQIMTIVNMGGSPLFWSIDNAPNPDDDSDQNWPPWMKMSEYKGTINPKTSENIEIYFNASDLNDGIYDANVLISTNDPDHMSVSLPVSLNITGSPDCVIFPESIVFNDVIIGNSDVKTLTITNIGSAPLEISSLYSTHSDYTANVRFQNILPAQSKCINIFFSPSIPGIYDEKIHIISNDPDDNHVIIPISGLALIPPKIEVSPLQIKDNLQTSEHSIFSITLTNAGGSQMDWYIQGGGNNSSLKNSLKELNENYQMITDLIPNRFDFSGGSDGYQINDGGNDMYDNGNRLFIDSNEVVYSDKAITTQFLNDKNEAYFTIKKPGLFIFASKNIQINTFKVSGNLGVDGYGSVDACVLETRVYGMLFKGFVKRVFSYYNPSVNHLIIIPHSHNADHEYSTDSNNDEHTIFNLSDIDQLYYLLFSSKNGGYIDNETMIHLMNAFIQCVKIFPDWLEISKDKGNLSENSSEVLFFKLNASELFGGDYVSQMMIGSNDPDNETIVLPVSIHVTGIPNIDVPVSELDFGDLFISYSGTKSFTITNTGSDILNISEITPNNSDYNIDIKSLSLFPKASQQISISCSPLSKGLTVNELIIKSNDPDEPIICITIKRNGKFPPKIIVKPDVIESSLFGRPESIPLTIINADSGKLVWQIPENRTLSSTKEFTSSDNTTIHEFNCGLLDNDIALTLTIYGDFDGPLEYCDVYINYKKIDTLINTENSSFYLQKRIFLDSNDVKQWTSDQQLTIRLKNASTVDILPENNIHHVQLEIIPFKQWLSVSQHFGELDEHEYDQLSVLITPLDMNTGVYDQTIRILTNDPEQPVLEIPIVATITGIPEISVTPVNMTFNDTWVGCSETRELTIANSGTGTLELTPTVRHLAFTITTDILPLPPGTSHQLSILFSPSDAGSANGELVFITNDPDTPVVIVPLYGSASLEPEIVISPSMITENLFFNTSSTKTITITNKGSNDLFWNVSTEPTLNSILKSLNNNFYKVTGTIPHRYDFLGGIDGSYIHTGGNNMFDYSGNKIYSDGHRLYYSNKHITQTQDLGDYGEYFTAKYEGLFVFSADHMDINKFAIDGYIGGDEKGSTDQTILELNINDTLYTGFVKRVYGKSTPSVNHIIITEKNTDIDHYASKYTSSDDHRISNMSQVDRLHYLLFAGKNGAYINNDKMLGIMKSFLVAIGIPLSINVSRSEGIIETNSSESLLLTIHANNLVGGDYISDILIFNHIMPDKPVHLPVSTQITGIPDIDIPLPMVEIENAWIGYSTQQSITIANAGSDTLFISKIISNHNDYIINTESLIIYPNQSKILTLWYSPSSLEESFGEIQFFSNDPDEKNVNISIKGFPVNQPQAAILPSMIYKTIFSSQSNTCDITISNHGGSILQWQLSSDLCNEKQCNEWLKISDFEGTVQSNHSESVAMTFNASDLLAGTYETVLYFTSNDPESIKSTIPVILNVEGTPDISLSPTSIDLGELRTGNSYTSSLTITNLGSDILLLSKISSTHSDHHVKIRSLTILPKTSKLITIYSSPTTSGNIDEKIQIVCNDPDKKEWIVSLKGISTNTPDISLSSEIVDFGSIWTDIAMEMGVTITNAGSGALHISDIYATNNAFTLTPSSSINLLPGSSQYLTIRVLTALTGNIEGNVYIISNDPDEHQFQINVQGIARFAPDISVYPTYLEGNFLHSESSVHTLTITNTGDGDLSWRIVQHGSLHDQLKHLNASVHEVTDHILNPYNFSGGIDGCEIETFYYYNLDGTGNKLAADDKRLCYSDQQVTNSLFLGIHSSYYTAKYPGLFVFVADNIMIDKFSISGNLGSYWNAQADTCVLEKIINGNIYQGFVKRTYNNYSLPCINQLIITPKHLGIKHESSFQNNDNFQQISNISKISNLYYLFFIDDKGTFIEDEQILKIMTSFIKALNVKAPWLSASSYEGLIKPKTSETITISFDASEIFTGNYTYDIQIESDDPHNKAVSIPVSLSVTGIPDISLSASKFDFGDVWLTDSELQSQSFTIVNKGYGDLKIYSIDTDNDSYALSMNHMTIAPDQSQSIAVSFTPAEQGVSFGKIILNTNDPDQKTIEIPVKGTGHKIPDIVVSPMHLDLTINSLAPPAYPVTITNTGESHLEWNIYVAEKNTTEPMSDVPAWLRLSKTKGVLNINTTSVIKIDILPLLFNSWNQTLNLMILTNIPDHDPITIPMNITHKGYHRIKPCISVSEIDINKTLLSGNSVSQDFTISNTGAGLLTWTITDDIVLLSRKKLQYTDNPFLRHYLNTYTVHQFKCGHINEDIQLIITINGDYDSSGEFCEVFIEKSFQSYYPSYTIDAKGFGVDITSEYSLSANYVDHWTTDGTLEIQLLNSHSVDKGFGTDDHLVQLRMKKRSSFCKVSDNKGQIRANESQIITAKIQPQNLPVGSYQYSIIIQSNDTDTPELLLPVWSDNTGVPNISFSNTVVDFENVWMGNTEANLLTISNAGSGTLTIVSMTSDHPEFSIYPVSTHLLSGQSTPVTIIFEPNSSEEITAQLSIVSNDPDQGKTIILLKGSGAGKPEISLSTDSINEKLTSGETLTQTIIISNESEYQLSWQLLTKENIFPLETILKHLNQNYQAIIETIPGRYNFFDGYFGKYIADGLTEKSFYMESIDLFDFGNILQTEKGQLYYSDNIVQNSNVLGLSGKYFSIKYPGLFVFGADIHHIETFFISGELGADGKGHVDGSVLHLTVNDIPYTGFVKRVFGTLNPSVNHLIIIKDSPGVTHDYFNDTNNDYHRISNLSDVTRLYYLMYCGKLGEYIDDDSTLAIMKSFLHAIDDKQVRFDATKSSGEIFGSSSETIEISFHTGTLIEGNYHFDIEIGSNDPDNLLITLPLNLTITGLSALAVSPTSLNFGEVSVESQAVIALNITNEGTSALDIESISTNHSAFSFSCSLPLSMAAGDVYPLTIFFNPSTIETITDELVITSNAAYNNHLTIPLEGKGIIGPILSVTPVAFSETLATEEITFRNIMIENKGDRPLGCMVRTLNNENDQTVGRIIKTYQIDISSINGMVWVSNELFIIDALTNQLCKYSLEHQMVTQRYTIHSYANGITWDGSKLWIGDNKGTFHCYNLDGTLTGQSIQCPMVISSFIAWNGKDFIVNVYMDNKYYRLNSMGSVLETYDYSYFDYFVFPIDLTTVWWKPFVDDNLFWTLDLLNSGISRFLLNDGQFIAKKLYENVFNFQGYGFAHDDTDLLVGGTNGKILRIDDGVDESCLSGNPENQIILRGEKLNYPFSINTTKLMAGHYVYYLKIMSNDSNAKDLTIPVQLSVAGEPNISITPTTLHFDDAWINHTCFKPLTISNTGTQKLQVNDISTSDSACTAQETTLSLFPGESKCITMALSISDSLYISGIVSISSNDPENKTMIVPFDAKGITAPDILISTESLYVTVFSEQSKTITLSISNIGEGQLKYDTSIAFEGQADDVPNDWMSVLPLKKSLVSNESSPVFIDINAAKASKGKHYAKIEFTSNDTDENCLIIPVIIEIKGVPKIKISQDQLQFSHAWHNYPEAQQMIISNIGSENLLISNIFCTHPDFIPGDTLLTIEAENQKELSIHFRPGIIHTDQSTLYIISNDPDNITSAVLLDATTLTSLAPPDISITPFSIVDEHLMAGDIVEYTIVVMNSAPEGSENLVWTTDSSSFGASPGSGTLTVLQSETISISVNTNIYSAGQYQDELVLYTNVPGTSNIKIPVILTIYGKPVIAVPQLLDIGKVYSGNDNARTFTISNAGTDDLHISEIRSSSPTIVLRHADVDFSIPPLSTQSIAFSCLPEAAGNIEGNITITSNDPDNSITTIPFSATARHEPDINISPEIIEGTISDGKSITGTLKISNVSGDDLIWVVTSSQSMNLNEAGQIIAHYDINTEISTGMVWGNQNLYIIEMNFFDSSSWLVANYFNQKSTKIFDIHNNAYGITYDGDQLWIGDGDGLLHSYSIDGKSTGLTIQCPFNDEPGITSTGSSFIVINSNELGPVFYQISKTGKILNTYESTFEKRLSQITFGVSEDHSPCIWALVANFSKIVQILLINKQAIAVHEFDTPGDYSVNSIAYAGFDLWLACGYASALLRINDGLIPGKIHLSNNQGSLSANTDQIITFFYDSAQRKTANYLDYIIVTSNDPDEQSITIPVRYNIFGRPEIKLSSTQLEFGTITEGSHIDSQLTITNIGTDNLVITDIISDHPDIVINTNTFMIPVGHSYELNILLNASRIGPINSHLTIRTNDSLTESNIVNFSGEIVASPTRPVISLIGKETITIEVNT
ncbi:peptidase S8 and S53 subtilisin kexin sedolisin, partial [Candidatus Magnetomorum sp. HK-1]